MGVTKRGSGKAALVHSASTVFFLCFLWFLLSTPLKPKGQILPYDIV